MKENAAVFSRGPLLPDLCAAVDAAVPDLPERLLFPGNWPNRMTVKPVTADKPATEK
jgi:hypothetical protein